jgi:hypothetical protein
VLAGARDGVLAGVHGGATRAGRPGRRRRTTVVAVVAAVVVGGAGTAAAALALQHADERRFAHCYPFATTDFEHGPGPDVVAVGLDSAAAALDLCEAEWRSGALVSTAPYAGTPGPVPSPVPPLVACVLPSGSVGVFPGPPGTCDRLGLAASAG